MVLMRYYLYLYLKIFIQNSLVLLCFLVFVTPQWSNAVESVDCADPTVKCFVEQGGQTETARSNPTLERISVLNKIEKSPIPTALVIVGNPKE